MSGKFGILTRLVIEEPRYIIRNFHTCADHPAMIRLAVTMNTSRKVLKKSNSSRTDDNLFQTKAVMIYYKVSKS